MLNAVLIAVIVMLGLSLARVHVVLSLFIGALVGGLLGGLGLDGTMAAFQDGLAGGAQIALSYALLGAFAMSIANSGLPDVLAGAIVKRLNASAETAQRTVTVTRYALVAGVLAMAVASQNLIPVHIAFIPLLIPPLLTVMDRLRLDRRLVACVLTFGLVTTYMYIPLGFGSIFLNEILLGNIERAGMDVSGINVMDAMGIPALGMVAGLLIAVFISYRRPRAYAVVGVDQANAPLTRPESASAPAAPPAIAASSPDASDAPASTSATTAASTPGGSDTPASSSNASGAPSSTPAVPDASAQNAPTTYRIVMSLIAIAACFSIQLIMTKAGGEANPLLVGAIAGLAIMLLSGAVPWRNADDVFTAGMKMMAVIGFIMISAQGFAAVMDATGAVAPLVEDVTTLFAGNKAAASFAMLVVGLVVTLGIGSSFSTLPIIATIYVPLCVSLGFSPLATVSLIGTAGALGDAGSPASDSTLGPTAGLNADGQHDHIRDSVIPTFLHFTLPLLAFGWVASLVL